MAVESQYSDSARADNPELKKTEWKPIGDLAKDLVGSVAASLMRGAAK